MILRKPTFTILEQDEGLDGIKKQIELAGRTCYKSLDKITETSANGFVNQMAASKHGAMLEHGTVYLMLSVNIMSASLVAVKYENNKYSRVNYVITDNGSHIAYVTTNYRVLVENNWLDDLQYLSKETEYHEKRVTVKFEMDRVGSQSSCRHRVFSFGQESTRFCNYKKDKFGSEIKISKPHWVIDLEKIPNMDDAQYTAIFMEFMNERRNGRPEDGKHLFDAINYWMMANEMAEFFYFKLIDCGLKAEDARAILPLDLDTELVMTGFVSDWKHYFDLRVDNSTGKAHPDINRLTAPLKEEFIKRGYLPEEIKGKINS